MKGQEHAYLDVHFKESETGLRLNISKLLSKTIYRDNILKARSKLLLAGIFCNA